MATLDWVVWDGLFEEVTFKNGNHLYTASMCPNINNVVSQTIACGIYYCRNFIGEETKMHRIELTPPQGHRAK